MLPIRVVLITAYFPAHRGGIELFAGALAGRLAESGNFEFTWFASDTDPAPPYVERLRCVPARTCNAAERRLGIPYPLWSPFSLRELFREVRSADIVHLHDCLYLPNLAAFLVARVLGRPVVVTQHIGAIPYRSRLLRLTLAAANAVLGKLVLGRAEQAVFVSATPLAYFSRFVRFRAAPLHIANGVDTEVFRPASGAMRSALRERFGVSSGKPLLLFVGRFVEKKGMHVLRSLAERLPGIHWIFAGWGALDPRSWLLDNVSVHSGLRHAELAALYQAADLLVLPSVGEGFPLVVQEAMACGTPALVGEDTAAGCPGAGPLLLSENVGRPDTAQRWAARIEALVSSPGALSPLRHPVAEFARTHWSWERCAGRYAEVLSRARAAREPCS